MSEVPPMGLVTHIAEQRMGAAGLARPAAAERGEGLAPNPKSESNPKAESPKSSPQRHRDTETEDPLCLCASVVFRVLISAREARRRGFTLLELLVFVSIIAVLAALLLPVLGQARGQARRMECLSRLKQWQLAFGMYVEENDDWIPRESYEPLGEVTINNWSQVKGRTLPDGTSDSRDVWYNALPPYLSQRPVSAYAPFSERPNFFDSRLLIHCPVARFPSYAHRPNYPFPLFSLAMNSQLIQVGPTVKFSAIERADPVRTVVFLDNLLDGEAKAHPAQQDSDLGQPSSYANRFSARHQRGGNLAFADGHVQWYPGNKVVQTDPASPLVGGPIVPPNEILWDLSPF
jgi:prepilin-type processing-associated H-X9-DG protein/prepilin-type N-terminal cleavage/methylation domain-containing protein